MPDNEKIKIADDADMIVGGYAYLKFQNNIRVVNLNKKDPGVMMFTPDGDSRQQQVCVLKSTSRQVSVQMSAGAFCFCLTGI